jgi:hypothetical protein
LQGDTVTDFYDSAGASFPRGAEYVMLYADGDYAYPAAQSARWRHVRWITVLGGRYAAAYAGAIDYERGNPDWTGDELREWARGREAMRCRARVYCNVSSVPKAAPLVEGVTSVHWWLADWDGPKTRDELAAACGGLVRPEMIWGQQYAGDPTGGFDTSVLLGLW